MAAPSEVVVACVVTTAVVEDTVGADVSVTVVLSEVEEVTSAELSLVGVAVAEDVQQGR